MSKLLDFRIYFLSSFYLIYGSNQTNISDRKRSVTIIKIIVCFVMNELFFYVMHIVNMQYFEIDSFV